MDIQPIQILLQIVNFGLVVFILIKFLYRPIAKVLETRSEKIKEGLEAAEISIAEKDKLDNQIKTELAKARKEAAKIIAEAKKQADIESAATIAAAKELAKRAADNEKTVYDGLLIEARLKAENELKELVTVTTAKVLKNGLTEADQHRIIDSQLKMLGEITFN